MQSGCFCGCFKYNMILHTTHFFFLSHRVSLEDLYNGKTTKLQLSKNVLCGACNGWVCFFILMNEEAYWSIVSKPQWNIVCNCSDFCYIEISGNSADALLFAFFSQGGKAGAVQKCVACRGRGMRIMIRQLAPGMVQQMQSVCTDCNGEGNVSTNAHTMTWQCTIIGKAALWNCPISPCVPI